MPVTPLTFKLAPLGLFESYVTVYVIAVHCAYRVWFSAVVTVVSAVTCSPPESSVNQPSKMYPVLVIVGNSPYGWL